MRIFFLFFLALIICPFTDITAQNTDSLYQVARTAEELSDRVNAWLELSEAFSNVPERSCLMLDSAESAAVSGKNEKAHAAVLYYMGIFYSKKGDYKEGEEYFEKSLTIAERVKDNQRIGALYNALAITNLEIGNYNGGLEYFFKALKIAESMGYKGGVASTTLSMGAVYEDLKNTSEALKCFRKALALYSELGDSASVGVAYNNIGNILSKTKPDSGITYFLQAEKILRSTGDLPDLSLAISNLGEMYVQKKEPVKAMGYLSEYMQICRMIDDQEGLSYGHSLLARTLVLEKRYHAAFEHADSAVAIAKAIGNYRDLQLAYDARYETALAMGDHRLALEWYRNAQLLKDSILNLETTRNMNQLQTIYETEKKDKELLIKNGEIERQQADASRKASQRNAMIAGLVLVLLLSGVTYNGYLNKKKANVALSEAYVEIEEKNRVVEARNKDILDSINYAKRIQEAILPPPAVVRSLFPHSFVLYKPKDIVCGDFYWFEEKGGKKMFAAVDCTGHGVPGAFMSVVGYNHLNQAVNEMGLTKPSDILDQMNRNVTATLRQSYEESSVRDGMDLALVAIDPASMTLEFAGANNPVWLIRNSELIEIKGDKFPVGFFLGEELKKFTNHTIKLQSGDSVYVFSDGFEDQFGGEKGKKFMSRRLKQLLQENQHLPMEQQLIELENTFESYRGNHEQVDDICMIGVKI